MDCPIEMGVEGRASALSHSCAAGNPGSSDLPKNRGTLLGETVITESVKAPEAIAEEAATS
jgi:hypothetical protein